MPVPTPLPSRRQRRTMLLAARTIAGLLDELDRLEERTVPLPEPMAKRGRKAIEAARRLAGAESHRIGAVTGRVLMPGDLFVKLVQVSLVLRPFFDDLSKQKQQLEKSYARRQDDD